MAGERESNFVKFFAYGPFLSYVFRQALFGDKIPSVNATLPGYELTIQHFQDLPEEVQKRLRQAGANENYQAYSLRPNPHAHIRSIILYLTKDELEIAKDYDMYPLWYDYINVEAVVDEGLKFKKVAGVTDIALHNSANFELVSSVHNARHFLNGRDEALESARKSRILTLERLREPTAS